MLYKALLSTLAAFGAAALVATGPAGAADDVKPTPCNGVFAADKAGDQTSDPVPALGIPAATKAGEDSLDIREVFFTGGTTADGKPQMTAHMVISNLSKELPENSRTGAVSYTVHFDVTETNVLGLVARNIDGEISYGFKYYPDTQLGAGTGFLTEGETTGSWVDGEMGVVSIDVPVDRAEPGTTFENVFARSSTTTAEEELFVGYNSADLAPDTGAAAKKNYTFSQCPAPVVETTPVVETAEVAPVVEAPVVQAAPAAAPAPVVKKVSKRAACLKKAKKIKNKRKRAKAVKRCKKLKR